MNFRGGVTGSTLASNEVDYEVKPKSVKLVFAASLLSMQH